MADSLDGIDEVPWASLSHAFGSAANVPGLLRSLLSDEKRIRDGAYDELFQNIWHQGTVYEATPHALPFLIRIVEAPNYPEREWAALLVANIIAGRGYYEVHSPLIIEAAPGEFDGKIRQEKTVVSEIRRIGREVTPLLAPFLNHAEPEIRLSIAEALACYPAQADHYRPLLEHALANEHDEEVRAVLDECIRRLNDSADQ